MPYQEDKPVFPYQPPVPPRVPKLEDAAEIKAWADKMYDWCDNLTKGIKDQQQQLVDKYNLHIKNEYGHPQSWNVLKRMKNRFYAATSGGTTVTMPASATEPIHFSVGSKTTSTSPEGFKILEATSDLTCDLSGSGVGGLDTGAVAANTPYYLYAVNNSGSAGLIASATAPSTGPTGYTDWSYQGATCTDQGAATITTFHSINGVYLANEEIEFYTKTTAGRASQAFSSMPATALLGYFSLNVEGTVIDSAHIGASDDVEDTLRVINVSTTASRNSYVVGYCPVVTAQTIYLTNDSASNDAQAELLGWYEDLMRYK